MSGGVPIWSYCEFASVTGPRPGRIFKRAHTAGLVAQRAPSELLVARVNGVAFGEAFEAARRAHTTGFVVQRSASGALAVRRSARTTAEAVGSAVPRAFSTAFKRAHTAGLVVQRSAATLSPALPSTKAPANTAEASGNQERRTVVSRMGATSWVGSSSLAMKRAASHEQFYSVRRTVIAEWRREQGG